MEIDQARSSSACSDLCLFVFVVPAQQDFVNCPSFEGKRERIQACLYMAGRLAGAFVLMTARTLSGRHRRPTMIAITFKPGRGDYLPKAC
jgi:hypothetical protein